MIEMLELLKELFVLKEVERANLCCNFTLWD